MSNVNHPKHYRGTNLECIEVMRLVFDDVGVCYFCLENAFKYLWRHNKKNNVEDLNKAKWYLDYSKKVLEVNNMEGSELGFKYKTLRRMWEDIVDLEEEEQ